MGARADIRSPSPLGERYVLGDVIGVGGTATVHRAVHRGSGHEVAVKIFNPGVAGADGLQGQRSVAAVLTEVDHPGLVAVHESGVDGDRMYLVMQLVDGPSLSARFLDGPLPVADVIALGARLADALAHVHDRGVVHRDIKPSNVLLDASHSPYLTDFGISRLVDTTRVTATGMTVGTPAFMAPEQVRGQLVGRPADIYSLGLVLLEAVTGRREYPGGVVESAVARLHRDPAVPEGLPEPLGGLLAAMTAQDPAQRPTAAAVAARLGPASGHTREIPVPAAPGHRTGVWISAAAATLLLAATVSGLVDLTGSPGPATAVTRQDSPGPVEPSALPAAPTAVAGPAAPVAPAAAPGTPPGTGTPRDVAVAVPVRSAAGPDSPTPPVADRPGPSGPGAEQPGNGWGGAKNTGKGAAKGQGRGKKD